MSCDIHANKQKQAHSCSRMHVYKHTSPGKHINTHACAISLLQKAIPERSICAIPKRTIRATPERITALPDWGISTTYLVVPHAHGNRSQRFTQELWPAAKQRCGGCAHRGLQTTGLGLGAGGSPPLLLTSLSPWKKGEPQKTQNAGQKRRMPLKSCGIRHQL